MHDVLCTCDLFIVHPVKMMTRTDSNFMHNKVNKLIKWESTLLVSEEYFLRKIQAHLFHSGKIIKTVILFHFLSFSLFSDCSR